MLGTLFLRMGLTFVSFWTGAWAEYGQAVGMYLVFTVVNGVLGGVIFICHCTCNETVSPMGLQLPDLMRYKSVITAS